MMNGVALFLVLTSLVSGSFWSPSPDENNPNPNVIVKEGHQFVVVEYDQEGQDGNTKVSISPQYHHQTETDNSKEEMSTKISGAKELVCDAFGKCKHKIADVLGKVEDQTKEEVSEGVDKAKEVAGEGHGKLKDAIPNVMDEGKSKLKDVNLKVKQADLVDTPKRAAEDMERNVSKVMEFVQRVVKGGAAKLKANQVGEMAEKVADGTKDGGHRMKETAKHAGGLASDSVIGVFHLLGFSMAFGMSMWVTFASSYILGDALPKQQFGMLQSKLYPVYFKLQACSVGVAFLAHLSGTRFLLNPWEVINMINILISVLLSLVNLLYLEPRATGVMFRKVKLEKDAGRGRDKSRLTTDDGGEEVEPETQTCALSEKLRKLNRLSSYVNVMTLMSLSLHLVYLGQKIQVN